MRRRPGIVLICRCGAGPLYSNCMRKCWVRQEILASMTGNYCCGIKGAVERQASGNCGLTVELRNR